ncbi:Hypothetical protein D9617_1g085830 [Elsinoe fawcettii]|nr:Hypothetical protein D9617_1g085830 [Elsinoe fawcettii]
MPTHVLAVPFPGAGHTINMINTCTALATPDLQIHMPIMSLVAHKRHLASSGQSLNSNVHVSELAGGRFQAYATESDPAKLIGFVTGVEFAAAIQNTIKGLEKTFAQGEKLVSALVNPLMGATIKALHAVRIKVFCLFPSPWYMMRVAQHPANVPGADWDTDVSLTGIGDVEKKVDFVLGDAVDIATSLYYDHVRPIYDLVEGWAVTNTNLGLEGHGWRGTEVDKSPKNFMVGPMIPDWYLQLAEKGYRQTMRERDEQVPDDDKVLEYLDKLPEKSAVYVALGSHGDFSKDQAMLVISVLQKTKTPFVFLHREDTAGLRAAVGLATGGIITGWSPQLEVLAHPSVKFALTHGGFGTMMESIFAGLPCVTCPISSDQFLDTKVMEHLGMLIGCIGINGRRPRKDITDGYPLMPNDGGETVRQVLGGLLSSAEGAEKIEVARRKTLELRQKVLTSKREETPAEFEALRVAMSS